MPHESGTIRRVAWGEIFPWLMLPRASALAISLPVLFLATAGVLLMPLGWWGVRSLLPRPQQRRVQSVQHVPVLPERKDLLGADAHEDYVKSQLNFDGTDLYRPMVLAGRTLVNPLLTMLHPATSWAERGYWALGSIWNLLVWGLFGGILARMAVMRYGRDQREGLGPAYRFIAPRLSAFVQTPLFVLAAVVLMLAFSQTVGWISQWEVGQLIAVVVWLLVLLAGLIATVLVVGIVLGWPLIWGALSAEEMGDVFEATQRTFAYLYGRPLQYGFYLLVVVVTGSVTSWVVNVLAHLVVYFGGWGLWTRSADVASGSPNLGSSGRIGEALVERLNQLVLTVGTAFPYGFLFIAAGVVYLLVRRDADQIEFDSVHVPRGAARQGVPVLSTDESGVPDVDTTE